jgi:hypothetical protein
MGNLIWAGEYDQCVSINEAKWSGKYCYYQKYDRSKKFIFVNIFSLFALNLVIGIFTGSALFCYRIRLYWKLKKFPIYINTLT